MRNKHDKNLANQEQDTNQFETFGSLVAKMAELCKHDPVRFAQMAPSFDKLLNNTEASLELPVETEVPDVPAQSMSVSEESESASEEIQPSVSSSSSEEQPKKPTKPKRVATVAVQVSKDLKPKAPEVKREINAASKHEKTGGQRTPVSTKSKSVEVSSHYSPGGSTLFVKSLTTVVVKKQSGEAFVDATNVIPH